jgi:hypothetical protein
MRSLSACLAVLSLIGMLASPVVASTLEEKQQEASFSFSYVDLDNFGKTTTLDGQWQWIFGKGYHELGANLSYLNLDPDTGSSNDAIIFGPVYAWNWMPANQKVTGFLEASYGFVSGDLGDEADGALQGGVGAKVFVGNSAAVRFEYFIQRLMGSNGFDDQDSSGLKVGISIFGGKK